ncbi:Carbohydrate kinase PfkB [Gracilaria domingensis]|nr:Carbohydrate kinase PfkB [Gracilaria domingensis]
MLIRPSSPRNSASGVGLLPQRTIFADHNTNREYEILECPAWPVDNIVDTTGAGDAFIGGVAYGIVTGMELERMLSLASYVAAAKLAALGARTALPRRENVPDTLIASLPSFRD